MEAVNLREQVQGQNVRLLEDLQQNSTVKVPSLAAPERGACGSPGHAWRLSAAQHIRGRGQATGRPATASAARASRIA